MQARGKVVSVNNQKIHMSTCGLIRSTTLVEPLSATPAPKRRKLSKCKVCKP